jgi:hypothetical protein
MKQIGRAISAFASGVIEICLPLLAVVGLPFAIVIAVLFGRRYLSSPRPGVFGVNDVLKRFYRLSWVCGLIAAPPAAILLWLDR